MHRLGKNIKLCKVIQAQTNEGKYVVHSCRMRLH